MSDLTGTGLDYSASADKGTVSGSFVSVSSVREDTSVEWFLCNSSVVYEHVLIFRVGRVYRLSYMDNKITGEYGLTMNIGIDKTGNITMSGISHEGKEKQFIFYLYFKKIEPEEVEKYIVENVKCCFIDNGYQYFFISEDIDMNYVRLLDSKKYEFVMKIPKSELAARIRPWTVAQDAKIGQVLCLERVDLHKNNRSIGKYLGWKVIGKYLQFQNFIDMKIDNVNSPIVKNYIFGVSTIHMFNIYPVWDWLKNSYDNAVLNENEFGSKNGSDEKYGKYGQHGSSDDNRMLENKFFTGKWVVDGNPPVPMRVLSSGIVGNEIQYMCEKQDGSVCCITDDSMNNFDMEPWTINHIRKDSIITVTIKNYLSPDDIYVCKYVGNGPVMPGSENGPLILYNKNNGCMTVCQGLHLTNENTRPATHDEIEDSGIWYNQPVSDFDKSCLYGLEAGVQDLQSILKSLLDVQRDKHVANAWNKSGRTVVPGDFLVRKSDMQTVKILKEFDDLFVVQSCLTGQIFSIRKQADYKKFYLWTPKTIRPGDLVVDKKGNVIVVWKVDKEANEVVSRMYKRGDEWIFEKGSVAFDSEELKPCSVGSVYE